MKFTKKHRAKLSEAAKARYAKKPKPKKRGRKPGVEVSPMTLDDYANKILKPMNEKFMEATKQYSPAPVLTLCG